MPVTECSRIESGLIARSSHEQPPRGSAKPRSGLDSEELVYDLRRGLVVCVATMRDDGIAQPTSRLRDQKRD
jgi:hypothetical protein